jgi:pimeloyl-ACP methyl ester carboxylesterase
MTIPFAEFFEVAVDGAPITVARSGPDPGTDGVPVVVAIHGITASAMAWAQVADTLGGEMTLLAIDLRGRGGSSHHLGPYGIRAHAGDAVAVLDHLGVERALFAGHSMGAFVTALCAVEHPDRVGAVVLVDGGFRLQVSAAIPPDRILEAVVGPAVARLKMTWEAPQDYHAFWKAHPAFSGREDWTPHVAAYVDYDMAPAGPGPVRSRVSESAVRRDAADIIGADGPGALLDRIAQPAWIVRAPRGIMNDPARPIIPAGAAETYAKTHPRATFIEVADVNHYTVLMGVRGACAVADALRAAATAARL